MTPIPIHLVPHPHDVSEPCPGGCEDIKVIEDKVCQSRKEIEVLNRRIDEGHDQLTRFEARLGEGNARMGRIETSLAANTQKLDNNSADTSEILEIMRDGKAFFRFAYRARKVLEWTFGIATTVVAFYFALKAGK